MSRSCTLPVPCPRTLFFFFFNDTATTEIYTLSLHDALPIFGIPAAAADLSNGTTGSGAVVLATSPTITRSEEHTSELQSQSNLVCRLLLEKKKKENTGNLRTSRVSAASYAS